ncbi:hypothetical protein GCM10023224_15200 [Streptomonospora halophila]|uniref:Uncharacterized protein n=1 Tax=Streptomonospora halophila TaxID=427369 RepID=A0ABP9GAH3_9ACTN
MSEPLGHEPAETHDREYAPVLREDEEQPSRRQARARARKVTGTGVETPVGADPGADDGTEERSELEADRSDGEDREAPGSPKRGQGREDNRPSREVSDGGAGSDGGEPSGRRES